MKIDTEGTYTLQYTAEDSCGNETIEERTVEAISYSTVLFTDGTFIINEKSTDRDANVALHGATTKVYDPFDPNGSTAGEKYIFNGYRPRPWNGEVASVKAVEIGSAISPEATSYWFYNMTACQTMDLSLLDTSETISMRYMFYNCKALQALDVSHFDTSSVGDMERLFANCLALTAIDVTNFNTSSVANMSYMFGICTALTALDVTNFDTSSVTNMSYMFNNCELLTTLDLSNFDTSAVTNMNHMFEYCSALSTIYASSDFVVAQVTSSDAMFYSMSTNLVGGAGTVWNGANPKDKTYAHIDGGTADPGYFTAKS